MIRTRYPDRSLRSRLSWSLTLLSAVLAGGCTHNGLTDPADQMPAAFSSAQQCGACHPDQLDQWAMSMHAYSGVDPVMLKLREIAVEDGSMMAGMCQGCHTPAQMRLDARDGIMTAIPDINGVLIEDGLNCDVCHSIADIPPVADISFLAELDPSGPKYANLKDPVPTSAHASERRGFYSLSSSCAPCHQVNLQNGNGLGNTFTEWERSILSGMGVECQDCHMPLYTGKAALSGPVREGLHRHDFVGVDYAYGPFRGIDLDQQKEDIRRLLQNSVTVTASVPATVTAGNFLVLEAEVLNSLTGHSIPSGVAFAREMWIEVTVRNDSGRTIYRSGYLLDNDDLVTEAEDADLVRFGGTMYDERGKATPFTWRAIFIDDSKILPYLGSRVGTYAVPVPEGATGSLMVDLALRFRPMPPGLFRLLELEEYLPIEIFEMWSTSQVVPIVP